MGNYAWLRIVNGNKRHRIDLLGAEEEYKALSSTQRELRDMVRGSDSESDPLSLTGKSSPERPAWAGGAFVFLLPEHVEIAKEVSEQPTDLFTVEACLG